MNGLVQREWESFRAQVMAADAPEIQATEMRLAFFGGASAMFYTIAKLGVDGIGETLTEDQVGSVMLAITEELEQFAATQSLLGKARPWESGA